MDDRGEASDGLRDDQRPRLGILSAPLTENELRSVAQRITGSGSYNKRNALSVSQSHMGRQRCRKLSQLPANLQGCYQAAELT